jgi:hypothetical protein
VTEYIYDPISKGVTVVTDEGVSNLHGPFLTRQEAIVAAKKYLSNLKRDPVSALSMLEKHDKRD